MEATLDSVPKSGSWRTDISDQHVAYIRGKQLHAFRALLPFGLIASSFNSAIVIIYMAFHAPSRELMLWTGLMVVMGLLGARAAVMAARHQMPARPRPPKALLRPITESALLGLSWAMCPALLLPGADSLTVAMLLCVSAGMMAGGAYMLSTVPGAAIPFVASMASGIMVGLLRGGAGSEEFAILGLLMCFAVVMIRTTFWNYSNYVRTWLQQIKLKDQSELLVKKQGVISLLLNEFEQAASDCLWELDDQHRVVRPSDVLSERTGFSIAELDQQHIRNFFDSSNAEGLANLDRLDEALSVNGEINNLRLPVLSRGKTVWWRISAKPVFGEDGSFEGYRGVASDVTEKYEAEKQIFNLAHFDTLTGVPKREMMLGALDAAVMAAAGGASQFAVHALDLDRFKTINDVFGHSVGDAYLKATAERIKSLLGPNDVVARFGGDEFVILQKDITSLGEAMSMAVTIQHALGKPVDVAGANAQSSVSIGIAVFPDHAGSSAELLKFADLALLASKGAGRDAVYLFDTNMHDDVSERIAIEADLRKALANNEFSLMFQPIADAKTRRIAAFETLIRWEHPVRGAVGPDTFVPILEQAGLITNVGDWIIREAIREAATWDETVRVSINLSPLQVRNKSLITTVTHALAQTGLDPRRVDFEITETALFDDTAESLSTLHALHALGVTISLDDFGTGFSSLSLLRIFPFDKIKIDKSFVQEMEDSDECLAIVQSVIGLARSLGMRTTAEGVETEHMVDILTREGCVELQGYYFSRPQTPSELVRTGFLSRRKPAAVAVTAADDRLVAADPVLKRA